VKAGTLPTFKALRIYSNGEVVRWIATRAGAKSRSSRTSEACHQCIALSYQMDPLAQPGVVVQDRFTAA
jgi:hypothetical protein